MRDLTLTRTSGPRSPILILLWLVSLLLCSAAMAEPVAEITNATGTVHVRKPNGALRLASIGSQLEPGEILSAEKDSSVRIRFTDGAEVVLKPGARMRIDAYQYKPAEPAADELSFSLLKGGLRVVSGAVGTRGNKDAFRARTAVGNIGIRGTQFGLLWCEPGECEPFLEELPAELRSRVSGGGLFFEVTDGAIAFVNNAGEFLLTAPEWGYAQSRDLPPLIVREDRIDAPDASGGGAAPPGDGAGPPRGPPGERRRSPGFPLREALPLIATNESVGGFSAGLGVDQFAQCVVQ